MSCCQPYTRERTSHAPQTSGKRKSKNAKGLSHEVRPPTQRPVLKCLGRTVRPYSTVLTLEEPATGTARERGGGLSHEVSPPTQRTVPECIGRTVRPCSAASFEESATETARERGGTPTVLECFGRTVRPCSTASFDEPATGTVREQREVVSRGLISDTALVLGEGSCSTFFPGEPATMTACEREVISRVLTSNNRPVLECLGRPCGCLRLQKVPRIIPDVDV